MLKQCEFHICLTNKTSLHVIHKAAKNGKVIPNQPLRIRHENNPRAIGIHKETSMMLYKEHKLL